jgi:uncharacterized OB-fold protein
MEMNIYGYKCKHCGHVQYPYRTICRNCHKNEHGEFDIVPLAKEGTLLTFTNLYSLPPDFETVTIMLGIVELSDNNRITGRLNIPKPEIGMKVKGKVEVVRQDDYNKYWGMVFYEA